MSLGDKADGMDSQEITSPLTSMSEGGSGSAATNEDVSEKRLIDEGRGNQGGVAVGGSSDDGEERMPSREKRKRTPSHSTIPRSDDARSPSRKKERLGEGGVSRECPSNAFSSPRRQLVTHANRPRRTRNKVVSYKEPGLFEDWQVRSSSSEPYDEQDTAGPSKLRVRPKVRKRTSSSVPEQTSSTLSSFNSLLDSQASSLFSDEEKVALQRKPRAKRKRSREARPEAVASSVRAEHPSSDLSTIDSLFDPQAPLSSEEEAEGALSVRSSAMKSRSRAWISNGSTRSDNGLTSAAAQERTSTLAWTAFVPSGPRAPTSLPLLEYMGRTYLRQSKACMTMLSKMAVQQCRHCIARQAGDSCRFVGLRAFPIDVQDDHIALAASDASTSGAENAPIFVSDAVSNEAAEYPDHYDLNRSMDDNAKHAIESTAATSLLAILEHGLQHAQQPNCIRRARELQIRALCDFCSTGLFSASFMCVRCGSEYCQSCRDMLDMATEAEKAQSQLCLCVADRFSHTRGKKRNVHAAGQLIPVTRFSFEELQEEVEAMRAALPAPTDSRPATTGRQTDELISTVQPSGPAANGWIPPPKEGTPLVIPSHTVAVEDKATLDEVRFLETWTKGEPLVVHNVWTRHTWDPAAFMERYGSMLCDIVRCDAQPPSLTKHELASRLKIQPDYLQKWVKQVQVRQFFDSFGKSREERETAFGKGIWKLKDWPPAAEFCTSFPDIYADFNAAVPMPDYTRRDGCKNVSSLFPKNANGPDLGPKMYNAWPGEHTRGKKGTTCLHMDIADAVNILLYAADVPSGEQAAQWDIFRACDANAIRDFLRRRNPKIVAQGDPIHTQVHYLDDDALQDLYREKGVYSWRILQRAGQAVFIPAGCAHQVCNLTDCIKVAVDFLSPQNVARCFQLTEEFRGLTVEGRKSWKEDVLQLKAQLWYAWRACRELPKAPDEEEYARKARRRRAGGVVAARRRERRDV